jgi:hypothetical protein
MWREDTSLTDFPTGWSEPVLAIKGDVFEASHVYKLEGMYKCHSSMRVVDIRFIESVDRNLNRCEDSGSKIQSNLNMKHRNGSDAVTYDEIILA